MKRPGWVRRDVVLAYHEEGETTGDSSVLSIAGVDALSATGAIGAAAATGATSAAAATAATSARGDSASATTVASWQSTFMTGSPERRQVTSRGEEVPEPDNLGE